MTKKTEKVKKPVCYQKNEWVVFRETANSQYLIVNLNDPDLFYEINGLAAEYWLMIDGKKNFNEICQKLHKKCKLDIEFIEDKANKLIKNLLEKNLISKLK
ncbi:MAG: PqqD family protein [Bdellovibrionales bacterium]|nr:PqqD family protein [Bdellovibrionales bacterium]